MAKPVSTRKNKTANLERQPVRNNNLLFMFFTTFAGVAFGVLLSVGFMKPMLTDAVASATQGLKQQVVAMAPASDLTTCAVPNSGGKGGGGSVLGAETSIAPSGTSAKPPVNNGNKIVFVHKLISGVFATTTGTNSNTGPYSHNAVITKNTNTTTVTNTNDINVTNTNSQSADSGDAHSSRNTTGGNATSGTASNKNDNKFDINLVN